jgi:hypothetical protein
MKSIGANAYRSSISWPRIFPNGMGTVPDAVDRSVDLTAAREVGERAIEVTHGQLSVIARSSDIGSAIGVGVLLDHREYAVFLHDLQKTRSVFRVKGGGVQGELPVNLFQGCRRKVAIVGARDLCA